MKYLIILILTLFVVDIYGQGISMEPYYAVSDSTSNFLKKVPNGKLILDKSNGNLWQTLQSANENQALEDISKKKLAIKYADLTWYSLLPDTILGYYNGELRLVPKPNGSGSVGNADSLNGQLPAYYLSRTNHTGEQDTSTVTNLHSYLDSKLNISDTVSMLSPYFKDSDTSNLWQTNGNTATFPNNKIGTVNNADLRIIANNTVSILVDSLSNDVSVGNATVTGKAKLESYSTTKSQILAYGYMDRYGSGASGNNYGQMRLGNSANDFGLISYDFNAGDLLLTNTYAENSQRIYFAQRSSGGAYVFPLATYGANKVLLFKPAVPSSTPTNDLAIWGDVSNKTIGMERRTTSNTSGYNLSILAGGCTSGATDKNGGNLILESGISCGTGTSSLDMNTPNPSGTGTTSNTPVLRERIITVSLADNETYALPTGRSGMGWITVGDGEEYAWFSFTTAGVVTLITNSANVTTTGATNDKINVYDAGTNVTIENTFTATKQITVKMLLNL